MYTNAQATRLVQDMLSSGREVLFTGYDSNGAYLGRVDYNRNGKPVIKAFAKTMSEKALAKLFTKCVKQVTWQHI